MSKYFFLELDIYQINSWPVNPSIEQTMQCYWTKFCFYTHTPDQFATYMALIFEYNTIKIGLHLYSAWQQRLWSFCVRVQSFSAVPWVVPAAWQAVPSPPTDLTRVLSLPLSPAPGPQDFAINNKVIKTSGYYIQNSYNRHTTSLGNRCRDATERFHIQTNLDIKTTLRLMSRLQNKQT